MNKVISGKKYGYIRSILFRLLYANILGWSVFFLSTFADSVIGGNQLGENALAAVGVVTPIITIVNFFCSLFANGGGILHSKAIAENNPQLAKRIFSSVFFSSIGLSIVLTVLMLAFKNVYLNFYDINDDIRQLANEYYLSLLPYVILAPIQGMLYYTGAIDGSFIFTTLGDVFNCLTNVTLSVFLARKIGITGLGYASGAAVGISLIVNALYLFTKSCTLKLGWKFSFRDLWDSIKMTIADSIPILLAALLDIIINYYITKQFGDSYLGLYAIVNFAIGIGQGLILAASGTKAVNSILMGEHNPLEMRATLKISFIIMFGLSIVFTFGFVGFYQFWPNLFGIVNHIEEARFTVIALGATFIFQGFFVLLSTHDIVCGKVLTALTANVLSSFIFPLLSATILGLIFDYRGFVIGFSLSNILSLLTYVAIDKIKNKGNIFFLEEISGEEYGFDLIIDSQSISDLTIQIKDVLSNHQINESINNKTQLLIEEMLATVKAQNKETRKIRTRIDLQVFDDHIRLIEKDNGKLFDMMDADQKVTSLATYVYTQLAKPIENRYNFIAVSTNDNIFEIDF